ncbi:MAG TPA: hypothetical protein VFV23_03400 [Verrucomicrobiae bacterium]|nr:hypothetical protein [Verrucomicrobiae bacterium]
MMESNKNPRRYKWPWFVLAAFILFVILAVIWVSAAVHQVKEERGYETPAQSR